MGKYFGTDGFRGEANQSLSAEHAFKIGRFIGWYYGAANGRKAKIVVGKDTRRSSYMFEYALVSGAVASGADAYLLHVTTTPSVAYVARREDFDCGVMISASHNPYYDNGIKLINSRGEKMEEETIALIEDYLDGVLSLTPGDLPLAGRENIGRIVAYEEGRARYLNYLAALSVKSFKGFKVALDCANGSAWQLARQLFERLGAQTHVINAAPDGTNINRDCGSTHIEGLRNYVVKNHMDVGFAYDGDADRCLCVDEKGQILDGDLILYICGQYMKEQGRLRGNTIVTTIMSNFGLYKALDAAGIGYAKTAVGDKYVYEHMRQHDHRIGGEQSGHIIFSEYASTGDGLLTSLMVMEVLIARGVPLSQLASQVRVYPQVLSNVRVRNKAEALADAQVRAAVDAVSRQLGDTGRILVRESGTEPVVRVMVEAESEALCRQCVNRVVSALEENGHAVARSE